MANVPAAVLTCCELMRKRPSPIVFPREFDKISPSQLCLYETYRIAQAEQCKLGKSTMAALQDANKAFATKLGNIEPESWQTGLEDCGSFYTHRWKELICHRLGHSDHDRNSIRDYNTRFTLPMQLKDLQGLSPMDYCLKYCILSPNRLMHYYRIFTKMRENRRPQINMKALTDSIKSLLGGTLEDEQAEELFGLFGISPKSRPLTINEFNVVCAAAERLFYQKNLRSLSEETQQMQRGLLELADFHQLKLRLEEVELKPELIQFLHRIANPGAQCE